MMALRNIAWLSPFLIALLSGCSTANSSPEIEKVEMEISYEASGTYSRIGRPVRLLVRDQATLEQLPLGEVKVDFDQQMVLVAALGSTPTSDFGVRIVRVWQQGARLRVQERRIHPGLDQEVGLHPASPWTLVVIPRSDLNVDGYSVQVPADLLSQRAGMGRAPVQQSPSLIPGGRGGP